MKKFFALLAVVLAVVSCQKDVDVDVNLSGDLATISVVLPEDAITRANWNGNDSAQGGLANTSDEVVRVIMHIYDDQGRVSDKRYVDYLAEGETTVTFDVRLVPNRQYTFVAWADMVNGEADDDKYFNTKDLRNVTMIEGTWDAMNEERDAFTATYTTPKDKPYTSSSNISLTLTRPFAKLRVVTNDMLSLNHLDIDPTIASVIYSSKHYQAFDAVSGKAINKADVAGVEHRKFTIKSYGEDWEHGADMTLFTDYFFAADGQEEVNFSLEVFDQNNRSIKYNNFNTPIPVKRNNLTTIAGNILTEGNNVTVTVDPVFAGKQDVVGNDSAAQTALDYAIANTTIYLEPGVDYGTLYIRPVAGAENTTSDCDYLVYRNELLRKVENLTIVGAEGATVDAIKVVAGYVKDSGSTGYVVDIKNLVIDSVEFTDVHTNAPHKYAAPIFFDLTYTNVDGLTVKNCKLEGDNAQLNFVYVYGSGNPDNSTFETAAKNITITNNTVDGIARLCELRQTENVTITNNTIKNTYLHGMLLTVDNGTYSGDVTITGNYAEGINERFVRMAGAGDAKVVIKDNTIVKYYGKDADYIKVTDANNLTVEKNYFSVGVKTADALATAIANANAPIVLGNDIEVACDTTFEIAAGKIVELDLNGKTLSAKNTRTATYNDLMVVKGGLLSVKNGTITIEHTGNDMVWNGCTTLFDVTAGGVLNLDGVTAKNLGGTSMNFAVHLNNWGDATLKANNCTFEAAYIAVRAFNSGPDMNNISIYNSTLKGKYCFWVHCHEKGGDTPANGGYTDATLNLDIINGTNTFENTGKAPIMYGFNNPAYYDAEGNELVFSADALNEEVKEANATVYVGAGEYTFPTSVAEGVTIKCAEGTVFTGTSGLDINGATVIGAEFKNEGGVAVSGNINGTFKNCTFNGEEALRWCYAKAGDTITFEDCVIKTDYRGFHFDGMDGNVIFRNCEINGFNAYGGEGTATFEGCTIGCDQSRYAGLNIYSNTNLVNCTFNYVSGKTNFIDMEGTGKTLKITNCTVYLDGVEADIKNFVGGSKLSVNTVIYE